MMINKLEKKLNEGLIPAWAKFVDFYKPLEKGKKADLRIFAKDVSQYQQHGKIPNPLRIALALQASGIAEIKIDLSINFNN